ncbi:MBG domain-containing protein [Parapedobacter koreensis]|nr:MBG domain-containing protein [Parapedobacter koreensis]
MFSIIPFKRISCVTLLLAFAASIPLAHAASVSKSTGFETVPTAPFAGGDGTEGVPYRIEDVDQLQAMKDYLWAHFILIADIDARVTEEWDGGFEPVGNYDNYFTGSLNGNGKKITGLVINRPGQDYVGLFGLVYTGRLIGVALEEADITGGTSVGGLMGANYGEITSSYATGEVSGSYIVGGLVGKNHGWITSSYATARVSGTMFIGGLVGGNEGRIMSSYNTGEVSGTMFVGGLVGEHLTTFITASFWNTETSKQGNGVGRGLQTGASGLNDDEFKQKASFGGFDFDKTWTIDEGTSYPYLQYQLFAGGDGTEGDPYRIEHVDQLQAMKKSPSSHFILMADIDASATAEWNDGAGFEPVGTDSNPFTGSLSGNGKKIRGLVVNRPDQNYAGLFGWISPSGQLTGVALEDADITGAFYVGGLVGVNYSQEITTSYVTGEVSGSGDCVGGLVGFSGSGKITASYATANVLGSNQTGGLVGLTYGKITASYATGEVSGSNQTGGLVGSNSGEITSGYWNLDASGQERGVGDGPSDGTTGLNDADFRQAASFDGFDFVDTWMITSSLSYPYLKNNPQSPSPGYAPMLTPPADGTYKIGDELRFTLDFHAPVAVTGEPVLPIMVGETERTAVYAGLSGNRQVAAFTYTVPEGDDDSDGVSIAASIDLNGGSIAYVDVPDGVVLTHGTARVLAGVLVDGVRPVVMDVNIGVSGATGTDGAYKIGDVVTVTWDNTAAGDGNVDIESVTVDFSEFGGKAVVEATNGGDAWTATYTIEAGNIDASDLNVSVTATDDAGNETMTADDTGAQVDNIAPSAPTGLEATPGDTQNRLDWEVNSEMDIASYRVYGGTEADPTTLLADAVADNTYTHTGLTNGTMYYYRISAVDAAGNESAPGSDVSEIPKAQQTIAFEGLGGKVYGDNPFVLSAEATSELPVQFVSNNGEIASIGDDGVTVTIHRAGTVKITASQAGGTAFEPAVDVKWELVIDPAMLTVTAEAKTKAYGEEDPELTYTYSGLANGDTESVITGTLSREPGENAGTYAITLGTLSAGSNYTIDHTGANLTITPAQQQAVTLLGQAVIYDGSRHSLSVQGLATDASVTYSNNNHTDAGTYEVSATVIRPNYEPLTLTAALTIERAAASIAGAEPQEYAYDGTEKVLDATLNHGEASLSYSPKRGYTDTGTYTITASAPQTRNYRSVSKVFTLRIVSSPRTLEFPPLREKTYGDDDFDGGAIASTREQVIYTSNNSAVAVIVEGRIRIVGAGEVTITATVPENGNYAEQPNVSRTLVVHKAPQTITLSVPSEVSRDAGTIPITATTSSGLPVTLAVDNPEVASLEGTRLLIHRLGTARITATQAGDGNHEPAEPVTVTVRVIDPASDFPIRVSKAVSPNGDGINEYLIIEAVKDYPENRVCIFNRNGTVVYEALGYNNGSVAFRGVGTGQQRVPEGTYFYTAEVRVNGRWEYRTGWFVLRY